VAAVKILELEDAIAETKAQEYPPALEAVLIGWLEAGWVEAGRSEAGLAYRPTALGMEHVEQLAMGVSPGPACRVCGCTDDRACPGGCSWAEPDLCSRCVS
jgi:hypothetical protein